MTGVTAPPGGSANGARSGFLEAENTWQPAPASRRTVARPMPLLPPVTSTTGVMTNVAGPAAVADSR
jgi:hypothetical protein